MIAFAAIDLRADHVVQLVGGDLAEERISRSNPVAVAEEWIESGFRALHIVDLDAAFGIGSHDIAIRNILSVTGDVLTQVGGGVRTTARAQELFDHGADRVVVGTRAVEDRAWLEELAERWPGRIVVAADVLGQHVAVRAWKEASAVLAEDFIAGLGSIPLAGVLVTDVRREGRMKGVDAPLFRNLAAAAAPHPLIASGGITGASDLEDLRRDGIAGVVLGMALYSGRLPAAVVAAACAS